MLGLLYCFDFEPLKDIVISYRNFNSKHHDICRFVLRLIINIRSWTKMLTLPTWCIMGKTYYNEIEMKLSHAVNIRIIITVKVGPDSDGYCYEYESIYMLCLCACVCGAYHVSTFGLGEFSSEKWTPDQISDVRLSIKGMPHQCVRACAYLGNNMYVWIVCFMKLQTCVSVRVCMRACVSPTVLLSMAYLACPVN